MMIQVIHSMVKQIMCCNALKRKVLSPCVLYLGKVSSATV